VKGNRAILIAVFLILFGGTHAHATAADEDFASFLKRFGADDQFRLSRIEFPLHVRVGSSCEGSEENLRWSVRHFAKEFTAPVPHDQLTREDLTEEIVKISAESIKIAQFHEGADSYLMTYTFKRRHGRWFLVHFEDGSC